MTMLSQLLAITGGTGFVGSAVIDRALQQGFEVRALARKPQPVRAGVEWITGTLADDDALLRLCDGAEAVVHIAGVVNAPTPAEFEAGNVTGTLNLVEAAVASQIARFVHVSSLAAREPSLSKYGASKERAEKVIAASGLDYTMLRPPAIYGPRDRDMLDLFKAARRGLLPVPPAGRMSVIHVDDLARLLLALIPGGEDVTGQIFEADDAHANGWSHVAFGKTLGWAVGKSKARVIPVPRWLMQFGATADWILREENARLTKDRVNYFCHPDWVIDPARRPPTNRWMPQIATHLGLQATWEWYRAEGWAK